MPEPRLAKKVRAGVVGAGHLGALHAAKYAGMTESVELVGVHDIDPERARAVAARHGTRAYDELDELLAAVDAASIATPTATHRDVARRAIVRGVDVLVEKPLAASLDDGRALVDAAARGGVLLFVGHLERFNPAFADLPSIVGHPRFVECHRLSPFAGRGTDTDVVFDVMIHDLDLIAFVVGRPLASVEAIGVPVLSSHADIANARLRFEGGTIANVTASRVSLKRERRLRIFQEDAYVAVDFDARSLRIVRRRGTFDPAAPMDAITVEERAFADDSDPLREEIAAFVSAVAARRSGAGGAFDRQAADAAGAQRTPRATTGREALVALEMAERVRASAAAESTAGAGTPATPVAQVASAEPSVEHAAPFVEHAAPPAPRAPRKPS